MTKIFKDDRYNWTFQDKDTQVIYIYYGFSDSLNWRIKRKTIATSVWGMAGDIGVYELAWADRENKVYT